MKNTLIKKFQTTNHANQTANDACDESGLTGHQPNAPHPKLLRNFYECGCHKLGSKSNRVLQQTPDCNQNPVLEQKQVHHKNNLHQNYKQLFFHFENRGEQIMTKDKLLAIGDKYEPEIAADRAADAPYR